MNKREEVLKAIKPICEVFKITDYDYIISDDSKIERLKLNNTYIRCSCNSISATIDELIGYIFINTYCRNRSLGAFSAQVKSVIKAYWIKEDK